MTSSAKDFSIPDFGSAEQNEDMSEDCRLATVKSLVPLNQSSIIYDEETLMKMTDEELKFFENYKRDNHAQMPSWKCTICPCQLSLVDQDNIRIHPVLGVLVCKNCHELYSNCPFSKDENGHDEYCRWCAKDGRILCCDTCTNVFCVDCLRRTFLGRMRPDQIPSKYSCLVCYNLPLWSRRALCRMVMSVMPSTPGRKSLSRRTLQDTNDSSDPSIWWPAIISKAEKLASYSKALASKLEEMWSKECEEADGSSCHQQKDKVIFCRKLCKALDTTLQNMKLLDELVAKLELKYGITADQQESSILRQDSTRPRDSSSSSSEIEATALVTGLTKLPTSSSIPDRNETVLQPFCSDSDFFSDTQETENIPDEAPESAEEKIIIECDSRKSQKGKEVKEETKKTKKRPIQSDSDFQSSESKEEKKKPKTEQVVAGRSVAGIPVDQLQNFSVQQAASFFRCGLS